MAEEFSFMSVEQMSLGVSGQEPKCEAFEPTLVQKTSTALGSLRGLSGGTEWCLITTKHSMPVVGWLADAL